MFVGAINAFTGEKGAGTNVLNGDKGVAFPEMARYYKAKGLSWIAIGDENYGEGSSREHAAMSPRFLGTRAVVARSFARIHETNLKKQGVLPLTFANPSDYDKVLERDRASLKGLKGLTPDSRVTLVLNHEDGSVDEVLLRHTLSAQQIEWIKFGSALNRIAAENRQK
jgi:aconitate hydratase